MLFNSFKNKEFNRIAHVWLNSTSKKATLGYEVAFDKAVLDFF